MRLAFPGLMAALAEGATIVTPTPLLASVAAEQFNRAQLAVGKHSWERPSIASVDVWMSTCWQQARFVIPNAPSLLSPAQERELWRQIIEQDRPDLFDMRAMASIAQRASRVLAEYLIPTDGEAWSENPDAQNFLRWHTTLQQRLKAENWLARSDLWRLLPNWIARGAVDPGAVTFAALTTVSPGLKRLAQRNVGVTQSIQPLIADAIRFESVAHEIEHAARAVRYLLETEGVRSIGILVADLEVHARDLNRIFREVLYPSSAGETDAIHLQFGALLSHPVISNALLILELAQPRIHHASAGAILRSPFIDGAARERSARALADNRLRRVRELDFSLTDLESVSAGCPALSRTFKSVRTVSSKMRQFMQLPDWSGTFNSILEAAKWPALDNISESEQLAVDQWKSALSELASLGLVSPPVSLHQAITHLKAILRRPSELGSWSSPVQILDATSAGAIEFDHSLVLNASEDAWPPSSSLSPLIPYNLQRMHQVPGSNPESAAEERLRITGTLFTSAPKVQLSFTGNVAPAMKPHIRAFDGPSSVWSGLIAAQSYSPVDLEAQDDSHAPPLVQLNEVPGGSSIIKSQSLCPFRAFAEYRLNARGDDEACFGFDALERGNFVHKALELVWRQLGTQFRLKSLADHELRVLVQECIEAAVADNGSGPIRTLTSAAERERLTNVVTDWLTVEKARPQPFTVEYLEEKVKVEMSGLQLALRVDRIDRLRNGSLVLIDYKSGLQSREKLKGDRPKEPQLLVYAAAANDPVEGIYFAELKNRNPRAVGHGTGKHFHRQQAVTDHKTDWDDFLETSRDTVHKLAGEFKRGEAAVNPQKGACEYCKIKPICRINSAGNVEEDDE